MSLFIKRQPQAREVQQGVVQTCEQDENQLERESADVQATLVRLKSEYAGLPERIGRETRRFHAALEAYNKAKVEVQ